MKIFALVWLLFGLVACGGGVPEGGLPDEADGTTAEIDEGEKLEIPPEGALPLSEIIASIEVAAHISITEVEFEDGVWVVEFVVGGEEYELEIDPMTGEALSDEPRKPDND